MEIQTHAQCPECLERAEVVSLPGAEVPRLNWHRRRNEQASGKNGTPVYESCAGSWRVFAAGVRR